MQELPKRVGSVIHWVEYDSREKNNYVVREFGVAARHADGWRLTNEIGPWSDEQLLHALEERDVRYFQVMTSLNAYQNIERRAKRANKEIKVLREANRILLWRWIQLANILRFPQQEGRGHNWLNANNAKGMADLLPPTEMWSPGKGWIPSEFERYILDKARARVALWLPLK